MMTYVTVIRPIFAPSQAMMYTYPLWRFQLTWKLKMGDFEVTASSNSKKGAKNKEKYRNRAKAP